ncbi:hypothetical protein [Streptomyces cyaneofuscatus]|uniref:hypothetical protein n=1 Tax=Streptomyces cyaneofuscatus TaxID=66883 RepID=UPI0036DBC5E8
MTERSPAIKKHTTVQARLGAAPRDRAIPAVTDIAIPESLMDLERMAVTGQPWYKIVRRHQLWRTPRRLP